MIWISSVAIILFLQGSNKPFSKGFELLWANLSKILKGLNLKLNLFSDDLFDLKEQTNKQLDFLRGFHCIKTISLQI